MILLNNMKKQKQFEEWALKELKKLQKILLLDSFEPLKLVFDSKEEKASAKCKFSFPYKTITIEYSKELYEDWKKKKYKDVIDVLTHEMCHPITDPLYDAGYAKFITKESLEDIRENTTDHIANIIIKIRNMIK